MSNSLDEVLEKCPTHIVLGYCHSTYDKDAENVYTPPKRVVITVLYSEKGVGFGEFAIIQTDKGVFIDTETSGKEELKRYLSMLIDKAIDDTNDNPEEHNLYNEVMGRRCGQSCTVCNDETERSE